MVETCGVWPFIEEVGVRGVVMCVPSIEVTQDVASRGVGVVNGCGHACSLYRGDPGGGISRYGSAVRVESRKWER